MTLPVLLLWLFVHHIFWSFLHFISLSSVTTICVWQVPSPLPATFLNHQPITRFANPKPDSPSVLVTVSTHSTSIRLGFPNWRDPQKLNRSPELVVASGSFVQVGGQTCRDRAKAVVWEVRATHIGKGLTVKNICLWKRKQKHPQSENFRMRKVIYKECLHLYL